MIKGNISTPIDHLDAPERVIKALAYLNEFDATDKAHMFAAEIGEGSKLYVNIYETEHRDAKSFEAHKDHIDIFYIVSGSETDEVCPLSQAGDPVSEKPENDIAFFSEQNEYETLVLEPGDYLVLFPEDVHKPGCIHNMPCTVKRVIVKVETV